MYASWQQVLGDFVIGYFSDQSREAALRNVVAVTIGSEKFYRAYVSALETGIEAASRGDPAVLGAIHPIRIFQDPAQAKPYLEGLLSEYQALYQAALKAREAGEGKP